ncbi:hypothetical protein [Sphingomonas sp. BE137]|uniref:hypothetical protein n=1 Tax=Sphingomonas sp. BE137 TaxID=2817844 RepID=UPI001AE8007D|nr:hypothetical protein [Sphingomonas sp. BE137]MDR6847145.1 threonine dehydrogenase-like Zn-dependent dehydrogenase [Sphingomonas sp. BE137]
MSDAKPGDRCSNGPDVECWTCPACYHDHKTRVTECADCGVALSCTIERPPIAVCTVIERDL